MTTLFITGIDTDIGKSVGCGALANSLLRLGHKLFTQKWVETGNDKESNDLLTHQRLAGKDFNTAAKELHAPYLFTYPASPHLSAALENKSIDCDYIKAQTKQLESACNHLLIEGAGGLCVPLTRDISTVDLIVEMGLPIILTTSGRLGSINHTVLSLELCQQRDIEVRAIIYNHFPFEETTIFKETRRYLQHYLSSKGMNTLWLELGIDSTEINLTTKQVEQLLA